eukprot:maker-scaffold911_size81771-snap-gene-0.16 protein:Tk03748 transcript:maker-scaffold911_size81771-snap-gene-0.16-mRNA-1 annotation:"hypothetical protein DAPPUDRAFT_314347"
MLLSNILDVTPSIPPNGIGGSVVRHSRGPRAANGSGGRGQISMKPTAKRVSSFQGGTLKTRFIPILATVMAGSNQSPTPSGAFNATPSLRSEAPQDFQTLWNLQVSPMDQMEQNELQVEQSKVEPRPVVTGVVQRDLKPTRNGTVQIFVSTLIHTLGCRDCSDQGCQKMRLVLGHFLTCQKTGASSPCLLCAQLIDIEYPPPCDHPIYCLGGENSLLHVVQMAKLYKDSKTFVDMPTRYDQAQVLHTFDQMMADSNNQPSNKVIQAFVDANFSPEGTEFEEWAPNDWYENPAFLLSIKDPRYKNMAKDVHKRWKDLGRKIRSSLRESSSTSLIFLEEPFIVPGGRFREMYYWDTYWTILGLIQSGMTETIKGMLVNFSELIQKLGHIPNGNRIYYNRRSQPPLYIAMVDEYHKATGDDTFVRTLMEQMDREFQFWINNRTELIEHGGEEYRMALYNVEVDGPRPESYREDFNDAQKLESPEDQLEFYMNMKSGAESGWDYSTRWFVSEDGGESQELIDIATRHIVPVDLNSYLCRSSRILSDLFKRFGNDLKATEYQDHFKAFRDAIEHVLWNEEEGSWFDFDLMNMKQRKQFYPSNIGPLWANCYPQLRQANKIDKFLTYLKSSGALNYAGGVPTSLVRSGQQWDYSNAWPPLQELIVTGLENTGNKEASDLALELVRRWVKNIFVSYQQSNFSMFEKYDVDQIGLPGGGGEYDVQEGFGWTNGVLLDFVQKYGDKISSDDEIIVNSAPIHNGILSVIPCMVLITHALFNLSEDSIPEQPSMSGSCTLA